MSAAPPSRTMYNGSGNGPLSNVQEHEDNAGDGQRAPSRDYAEPLELPELPELDFGDTIMPSTLPPSYQAATAAAASPISPSPATTPMPQPQIPQHAAYTHRRVGSGASGRDQPPYAPVDYPSQLSYDYSDSPPPGDSRFSTHSSNSNDLSSDFSNMRLTSADPQPRAPAPSAYAGPYGQLAASGLPPRGRSVTGGSRPVQHGDPSASVYSLDTGMNAYAQPPVPQQRQMGYPGGGPPPSRVPTSGWPNQPQPYPPRGPGQAPASPNVNNPYYTAANDFVGLPPAQGMGGPFAGPGGVAGPGGPGPAPGPSRQPSMSTLVRTNTSRSTLSLSSISSAPRMPIESVGASSTRRRGGAAAIDVSKPPYTREFVEDYRNRMKVDPDPEAQFAFAKYLIEAAKKLGDEISSTDPRQGRKYRDSLLAESLRNVKKLAEGKEPYADAQFFLANLYGTGQLGLQVDHEKAYYLYLMASKLNHPAATYRAAVCCELGAGTKRDANRSVLFYRKAAALGDTAAMYKLALILLNGLMGHPRNPREALVWLRRAAAQADEDNPHALHELALLHERPNNGSGGVIPHDPIAAREYLTQAAQLGYAPAQFKLGSCHEFGTLGFPIDPRRSIAWYTRAAERGDAEAELALSGWYLTGSEGVLKQSDTEAYLWGRKAANKGLAKAEYAVGYYTEIGIGVKQDMELAKRWYMRAASQGNKRAMQRLAELNSNRNMKGSGKRPTRKDAEGECVVM
ncbi:HCP-like protein [Cutaneotrichosporon oleaginosum]|uniref:HCP-like protein n=1 Tax=Cutaneotrichosporon oleaginosum TaxID=879819 RepID=A0A0J0XK34_9TREE|nr:HCP-like protein [Cutaneotrichosporon oleaginosum]KLT41441.1 HCP-like protein [Cutaneotrichosporon oleaginosum]TXT12202.1 hypothetical protein COLE_02612 [Cutaneotrichosporon oleaginosum]